MKLEQHIESLIFVSKDPISEKEIQTCLSEVFETKIKKEAILEGVEALQKKYLQEEFAIELVAISGGFQFLTKGAFLNTVGTYLKQTSKKKLSRSALETLSIIAYKQPISKGEMESIRGVSCDYAVRKLLEKELIDMLGRSDGPGRPMLYGTSDKFMDYFGMKSLKDLPKLSEIEDPENSIGEGEKIEINISPNRDDESINQQSINQETDTSRIDDLDEESEIEE